MRDVIIIGAGVSGSACAREISRYKADILVIEKEEDVCCGTSKANSAIVHAGYDAANGSLMAKLNVEGSKMMPHLSNELDFHYEQCGSLVLCRSEDERPKLQKIYENGKKNGVCGLEIISRDKLRELEPGVPDDAIGALWAPTGGIVCPFGLNIALAENACDNGAEFMFNTEVIGFEKLADGWIVKTSKGDIETRVVVNAAGVYAGKLHNFVSENKMNIIPRRGDYYLLDKQAKIASHTLFSLPNEYGKGVLVSPTVHGNTIVGPTAIDIDDGEATATTAQGLEEVAVKARRLIADIPLNQTITSFAGIRAHDEKHEFTIEEVEDAPGFVDCAGIESPGLSACPAIGKMVADIVSSMLKLEEKDDFCAVRKGMFDPKMLTTAERAKLINEKPQYGQIICRCEEISEGEILDAIHRTLGARSVDGVKRRVRAGMGRCQGGFCMPKVMEILARELDIEPTEITKAGQGSELLVGYTKEA